MTNNEYLEEYLDSCADEIACQLGKDYAHVIGDIYADDEIGEAVQAIWNRIEEIIEDA